MLPESLKEQTHLKEWYISNTLIQSIPNYIELFEAMRILDLPQNQLSHLPAEIGMSPIRHPQASCLVSRQLAGLVTLWKLGTVLCLTPSSSLTGLLELLFLELVASFGLCGVVKLSFILHSPVAQNSKSQA